MSSHVSQHAVSRLVDMLEKSFGPRPQFRSFLTNVPPQTHQNITVVLSVNSLSLGEEFTVHSLQMSGKAATLATAGSSTVKTPVWSLS